jgi:hypothetical protein
MLKALVLPYGSAGWKEKMRVIEDILSLRPAAPFLYNDVLILVLSSRMKRMYGRLFLDFAERRGSAALVQPDVQTLDQFLQLLYGRLNGPLLMDENSRLVLLEGIVKKRLSGFSSFPLNPDLLAPSLSSALAKMIEQLSGAGVGPNDLSLKIKDSDFSDKPQVQLLLDVYTCYPNALKDSNLTDPAGMRAFLRDHFDPAWLARYRTIIIDGIQGMGILEAAILNKAADCRDCTWLVDAPAAEAIAHAGDHHPLRIVRDTLGLIKIIPGEEGAGADAEQRFLSQTLFSDRPFSELADKAPALPVLEEAWPPLDNKHREEVTLIAGKVKKPSKTAYQQTHSHHLPRAR